MTGNSQIAGNEIILAIECAVGSGSVALMAGERVIAATSDPESRPSRAEEVLVIIDQLLKSAGFAVGDLSRIAVSAGPGSYSGIRIGLATALGLKHSLGIPYIQIPLLEAMAASSAVNSILTAAVPVGKKDIAWQVFGEDNLPVSGPELAPESEFLQRLGVTLPITIFAHTGLLRFQDSIPTGVRLIDAGCRLAEYLATFAALNPGTSLSRPLYLRNHAHTDKLPT